MHVTASGWGSWAALLAFAGAFLLWLAMLEVMVGPLRLRLDARAARRDGERVRLARIAAGTDFPAIPLSILVTDKRLRIRRGGLRPLTDAELPGGVLVRYGWHGSFGHVCTTVCTRCADGSLREDAVFTGGWFVPSAAGVAAMLDSAGVPVVWEAPRPERRRAR
jgi:hypothetical protein